jgi:hypothetical protein
LWVVSGPEYYRYDKPSVGRKCVMSVLRWTQASGWEKLELGENARMASAIIIPDKDAIWLGGIGVLRLPRTEMKFTPLSP